MTRTSTILGGLAVAMAAALIPPPQQLLTGPKALYGAAIVKAVIGDTGGALRLLQRSAKPVPAPARMNSASTCPLSPRA